MSVTGKLYKKNKANSSKPWMVRDFMFDDSKRILSYSSKGEVRGAVLLDEYIPVKVIDSSVIGKDFGIEIFCYKVSADGEIAAGLRRYKV